MSSALGSTRRNTEREAEARGGRAAARPRAEPRQEAAVGEAERDSYGEQVDGEEASEVGVGDHLRGRVCARASERASDRMSA